MLKYSLIMLNFGGLNYRQRNMYLQFAAISAVHGYKPQQYRFNLLNAIL